jgi:hypothetical protein
VLKSLRSKVFAFLSCLLLVSLTGVGVSFWITQRVNSRLSEINLRSVPMQRELTQLSSDTDLLKREMERSLGFTHWSDSRWKPRKLPTWASEVLRSSLERIKVDFLVSEPWRDWEFRMRRLNADLAEGAETLFVELQGHHLDRASVLYPEWMKSIEMLQKEVEWAKREIDQETRSAFRDAQAQVQNLRLVLQILVLMVVGWCSTRISPSNSQQHCGFTAAPADALPAVKNLAHVVLQNKGGYGCVREWIDAYILPQPLS